MFRAQAMAVVWPERAITDRGGRLQAAEPRKSPPLWAMGVWTGLAWAAMGLEAAQAQTADDTRPADQAPPSLTAGDAKADEAAPSDEPTQRWRYTLGLKLKVNDLRHPSTGLALRPVLGLRYGRWRLGHATGNEWLQFSGYRKEANLAYQLRDDDRLKVDLSLRIQNLKDNSSFDGFSSGENTLRARVGVNYQLNKRWAVGTDVTQDLLGRGDGTTLSVGASYGLPLSLHSTLSLSAGVNWATAKHWAHLMREDPTPPGGWQTGLGSVGLGLSYRHALTPQWAWFGSVGGSHPLGQLKTTSANNLNWSGQIGLLYFSR